MFFPALRCFVSLGMSVWWLRTCWRSPAPTADPSVGHAGGSCRQSRAVPGRLLSTRSSVYPSVVKCSAVSNTRCYVITGRRSW